MPFHPDQLLLYAVTDRAWTGRQTLLEQLEAALQGGVTLVQLREKDLDPAAFLAEALEVKALCRRYHVPLILNDQVDLALACGADGVHVGSEDLPVAHIRRRAGPDFIIGATAKTVQQAQAAQAAGANYLGWGPFSPPHQARRPAPYARGAGGHLRLGLHPAVAIGGIGPSNLAQLKGPARRASPWSPASLGQRISRPPPRPWPARPGKFCSPIPFLSPSSQPAASVPPGFDLCTNAAKETPP